MKKAFVLLLVFILAGVGLNLRASYYYAAASAGGGGNPYGTQVGTDTFTRANETPVAGVWTVTGSNDPLNLSSNTVVPSNTANDCGAYLNTWASGNNQYMAVKCTGTGTGSGEGEGVWLRHAGAANTGYRIVVNSAGTISADRYVTSAGTNIGTRSVSYSAGTVLAASINGTTIKIYYGGVQQGADITDAIILSGSPGLSYSSTMTGPVLDDADWGTAP